RSFFLRVLRPPQLYTLSLHDALPILQPLRERCGVVPNESAPHDLHEDQQREERRPPRECPRLCSGVRATPGLRREDRQHYEQAEDRKSTRLNSSHQIISYAVFCLKKK